jgi:hypothetical protein
MFQIIGLSAAILFVLALTALLMYCRRKAPLQVPVGGPTFRASVEMEVPTSAAT